MVARANPYPGWWASPDRDENGDPIRETTTETPGEELPEWYKEDKWNYQYFYKEENWYSDSSKRLGKKRWKHTPIKEVIQQSLGRFGRRMKC